MAVVRDGSGSEWWTFSVLASIRCVVVLILGAASLLLGSRTCVYHRSSRCARVQPTEEGVAMLGVVQ